MWRGSATAAALLAGCQVLAGYEDFSGEPPVGEHACADLPERKVIQDQVSVRVDVPGKTCLWIDQDEVTVQAYLAWLEGSADEEVSWDARYCGWKERPSDPARDPADACALQLGTELMPFAAHKPMRCVDWCDAEAYCRAMDKRLCFDQSVYGTQVPRGVAREWTFACNNGFDTIYPWGVDPEAGHCNVDQSEHLLHAERGVLPIGSTAACATRRGARDLLGNVAEWTYGCNFSVLEGPLARGVGCLTKGGSFQDPLQSCMDEATLRNDTRSPYVGFRCCAELNAEELLLVSPP